MASVLLNSFKASTTAISSQSLARTVPIRLPHLSRRHYSENKSANGTLEQEKEKEDATPGDQSAELSEKLKAKEAEAVDLTVSCVYTDPISSL